MANMRQELLALARPQKQQHEDSCTDVLLSLPAAHSASSKRTRSKSRQSTAAATTLVGHNEDMTRDTIGRIYFVRYNGGDSLSTGSAGALHISSSRRLMQQQALHQQMASGIGRRHSHTAEPTQPLQQAAIANAPPTRPAASLATKPHSSSCSSCELSWLGFVYAGELASSGFGVNSAGIGFTLNAVFPAAPIMPGFSRNFVSRQLLQARSIIEALDIIARPGQVRPQGGCTGLRAVCLCWPQVLFLWSV
jgi:hypothetical protein